MNVLSKRHVAAVVFAVLMLAAGVVLAIGVSNGWLQVI